MTENPPCLGPLQTYCHREHLKTGESLPYELWLKNLCRPKTSESSVSLHTECAISLLPLIDPTNEELGIQERFKKAYIRHYMG